MYTPAQLINLLEDTDEIVNYKYSPERLLIWPLARYHIIMQILNRVNKLDTAASRIYVSPWQKTKTVIRGLIANPHLVKKKQILFFYSGISNVVDEDQRYFNRVHDYFYLNNITCSTLIEDDVNWRLRWPRAHGKVYANLPLSLQSVLAAKFRKKNLSEPDKRSIKALLTFIREKVKIHDDGFWEEIATTVERICIQFICSKEIYQRFFRKKKPMIIFVEDACYGSSKAAIVKAASATGVKVAELQHGFVNEQHPAYNFGAALTQEPDFKTYYPNYYLTYGQYWSDTINPPCEKVVIGNPYLTEKLSTPISEGEENNILFLSSGNTVQESIDFLKSLHPLAHKNGFKIILRPHPLERPIALERYLPLWEMGVIIDNDQDVYRSIRKSKRVIGEVSTALFEARAAGLPVFLFYSGYTKTYYTDKISFQKITSDNLNILFQDDLNYGSKSEIEYFWAQNWQENYNKFLLKEIGIG